MGDTGIPRLVREEGGGCANSGKEVRQADIVMALTPSRSHGRGF